MRSEKDVKRGPILTLVVDGRTITTFEGETIATAMLAEDARAFRLDRAGRSRGLFCNMGVCSECLVSVTGQDGRPRRLRACVTPATGGMVVTTGLDAQP